MGERQEIHHHILLAQVDGMLVGCYSAPVHAVGNHHALAQARSTTGVKHVCQFINVVLGTAPCHLLGIRLSLAHLQELLKREAHLVLAVLLHRRVEDDKPHHIGREAQHTVGRVVLVLLAHKDETYVGIAYHILYLPLAAGCIKRDGDSPDSVGAKVHKQTLGHVLREDGHILLDAYAQRQQSIADARHRAGERVP